MVVSTLLYPTLRYLIEIVSESLEDGAFRCSIALEVVAVLHLFQCLLLVARQCLWHIYADVYHQVALAASISLHCRKALGPKAQSLSGLRSGFNLQPQSRPLDS